MSAKADTALGVISFSAFGVEAVLAPADALAWNNVFLTMAPAFLILFLIWRIYRLDKEHQSCKDSWELTRKQLALAHQALTSATVRCSLPSQKDFMTGNFDLAVTKETGDV